MFDIFKSVISAGGYKLGDMQHKIKKLHLLGDLDENQMDELLTLAAAGVSPDAERPENLVMMQTLARRMDGLEARLSALESGGEESPEAGDAPAYEAWQPWDGISDKYQPGAIVTHSGKTWQSIYSGQNVWEPGAAGTATLWEAI